MSNSVADVVAGEELESSPGEPILPRPKKKQRTTSYFSVSKLLDIFPDEAPGTLAILAESHESLSSEIVQLVPNITAVQLAQYGDLVEEDRTAATSESQGLDSSAMLKAIREQAARHVSLKVVKFIDDKPCVIFDVNVIFRE